MNVPGPFFPFSKWPGNEATNREGYIQTNHIHVAHMYRVHVHAHVWGTCTCKSYKSFSRGLRSGEAASRPWEMTYN